MARRLSTRTSGGISREMSGRLRRGGLASAVAGGIALLASAFVSAEAGEAQSANQLIACAATRADVAAVSLDGLRFGLADTYAWATATVRLLMRDQSTRQYALFGRADPIDKQMPPNRASPGFAYPGFACTIQYPAITSVRNCYGSKSRRSCEIGIELFGSPMAYSVALTAQRVKVREATLP